MKNLAQGGWPWFALERYWESGKDDLETFWRLMAGEVDLLELWNTDRYAEEYTQSVDKLLAAIEPEKQEAWMLRMDLQEGYHNRIKEENGVT